MSCLSDCSLRWSGGFSPRAGDRFDAVVLMRTRIKICCIASVDEARLAWEAGADALGLVARMPSGPGPIADELIATIAECVPPPVATFMLTSETTAVGISAHVRRTRPTAVQIVSHLEERESRELARLEPWVRRVQVAPVAGRSRPRCQPWWRSWPSTCTRGNRW